MTDATMRPGDGWDYVIVGAGSAGAVLAERLSRDARTRVLLVEAGGTAATPFVAMPKGIARVVSNPDHIWIYEMARPRTSGADTPEYWIRGRGLGGSSSVNGMIWSRGEPADYDDWAQMGCTGWTGAAMTRAFRSIEDHALGASETRGSGGPVRVTPGTFRYPLTRRMIDAGRQMGLRETDDLNGITGPRVGYYSHNIRRGRRDSSATAFLRRARGRPNLEIRTHTLARRLVVRDRRVVGVELSDPARGIWVEPVAGEAIVCAGTMESPLLLQRSGIGDGAALRAAGIAPLVDNPDVGRRMRDHLSYAMPFRLRQGRGIGHRYRGTGLGLSVLRYYLTRTGPLATGPFEVGAFLNVADRSGRTDLQLYLGGYAFALDDGDPPRTSAAIDRRPGISIYGQLLRLTSEGSVRARSPDPADKPEIVPNWLATEDDRRTAIASVRYMRAYMAQPALAEVVGEELIPGRAVESDDAVLDHFRQVSTSGLHATGTCRMGGDARSVVDARLRVRGVDGVRVADCSVMPALVTGNTNAPAMALGWRAADLILGSD